jgi:DNA-binding NarL/FixJ family response regulator
MREARLGAVGMRGRRGARIRVLLADDHTMFREGIASVLAGYGGMEIVGQADNDEGAVELARLRKPDGVLMQVQAPISRARENLRKVLESADPPPKVVIVTVIEDPHHVRELMELGASAYIVKSATAARLVAVVRAADDKWRAREPPCMCAASR